MNLVELDVLCGTIGKFLSPCMGLFQIQRVKKAISNIQLVMFFPFIFLPVTLGVSFSVILSSDKGCFPVRFQSCTFLFFIFNFFLNGKNRSSNLVHFFRLSGGGGGGSHRHPRTPPPNPLYSTYNYK